MCLRRDYNCVRVDSKSVVRSDCITVHTLRSHREGRVEPGSTFSDRRSMNDRSVQRVRRFHPCLRESWVCVDGASQFAGFAPRTNGHRGTELRRADRRRVTAGAGANNDGVKVFHDVFLVDVL